MALFDRVWFNVSGTPGTGAVTVGTAVSGYQTPASAGTPNGNPCSYTLVDGTAWETGKTTYTVSGTSCSRTLIASSTGSLLNASSSATFSFQAVSTDILPIGQALGMLNGTIAASFASNLLTITINTLAGAAPSASDPVYFIFRDATLATGDFAVVAVTAALSIDTHATGATLGTVSSNVPFRLWVVAFNDGGTVKLALWQSVTGGASPTAIAPLNEGTLQSSTPISSSAAAPGSFYTENGVAAVSSKAFRILGYVDYATGLATAGTYASAPTTVQLFGPGIMKPGDAFNFVYTSGATNTTTSNNQSSPVATGNAASISLSSAPNLVLAQARGVITTDTNLAGAGCSIGRNNNSTLIGNRSFSYANAGSGIDNSSGDATNSALDAPGVTTSTTYTVYLYNVSGGSHQVEYCINTANTPYNMQLQEIMV